MKSQQDFVTVPLPIFFQKLIIVQQLSHFPDMCIHYTNRLALAKKKRQKDKDQSKKLKSSGIYTIKKGSNIISNLYDNYIACGTTAN